MPDPVLDSATIDEPPKPKKKAAKKKKATEARDEPAARSQEKTGRAAEMLAMRADHKVRLELDNLEAREARESTREALAAAWAEDPYPLLGTEDFEKGHVRGHAEALFALAHAMRGGTGKAASDLRAWLAGELALHG